MNARTPKQMRALAGQVLRAATLDRNAVRAVLSRDAADVLRAAADEVNRLRAVIENAPHADWCMIHALIKYDRICNCWKADAL